MAQISSANIPSSHAPTKSTKTEPFTLPTQLNCSEPTKADIRHERRPVAIGPSAISAHSRLGR